jgi:hypothetical protein
MPAADDRVRIGIRLAPPTDVSAWLAEGAAFDAAGADALWLDLRDHQEFDPYVLTAALAAVTYRCQLVLQAPSDLKESEITTGTLAAVSRGRVLFADGANPAEGENATEGENPGDGGNETDRWEPTEVPSGRAEWRETYAAAAARGAHGLIVPADPRLLDLLRNPDEEIDRRDLQLASG